MNIHGNLLAFACQCFQRAINFTRTDSAVYNQVDYDKVNF